jgi:hypothetical protein
MCTSYSLRLGGFVRTIPDLSTFVHPVFLDHKGSPALQLIENDTITGWKHYRPDETLEFVNSNLTAKPGDPPVYGFVFTDDSLVFGEKTRLAKALDSDSRVCTLGSCQPHTYHRIRQFIDESSPLFFSLDGSECIEYATPLSSSTFALMLLDLLKGIGKPLENFICFHAPIPPVALASSGLQSATLRLDDTDEIELRWGLGTLTAIPRRSRPTAIHLSAFSNSTGLGDAESILALDIVEHEVSIPFEPEKPFFFVLNRTPNREQNR